MSFEPRRHKGTKDKISVESNLDARTETLMRELVDSAYQVHKHMGPGLLESIYEDCFVCELSDRNINYVRQKPVVLEYKHHNLQTEFKFDLVVEDSIVVELKACKEIIDVHKAQILSYMKLLGMPAGLLINFHTPLIKNGIKRFVL